MLKLLTFLLLISFQSYGYDQALDDTLMYRCQNAALAFGGYDEDYVNLTINYKDASEQSVLDFEIFLKKSLKVKSIKESGEKTLFVVRASASEDWSRVAIIVESFLDEEGFYGSCHLDL